jgi:hypothetical protein
VIILRIQPFKAENDPKIGLLATEWAILRG